MTTSVRGFPAPRLVLLPCGARGRRARVHARVDRAPVLRAAGQCGDLSGREREALVGAQVVGHVRGRVGARVRHDTLTGEREGGGYERKAQCCQSSRAYLSPEPRNRDGGGGSLVCSGDLSTGAQAAESVLEGISLPWQFELEVSIACTTSSLGALTDSGPERRRRTWARMGSSIARADMPLEVGKVCLQCDRGTPSEVQWRATTGTLPARWPLPPEQPLQNQRGL